MDDASEDAPEKDDEDARQLDRLARALAALDDETLRRALATMSETNRQDVANQLQLPRAAMSLGDALVPLVRRKARTASPTHQLAVAFALSEPVNDDTIEALGDRHEEPTRDDMLEVLPAIVERHGAPAVTLMLASYASSDAPCQEVFSELLDTDERFAIGAIVEVDDTPAAPATSRPVKDDAAQAEKRAQRKAAKDAKRAAEAREREAKAAAAAKQKQARRDAKKTGR